MDDFDLGNRIDAGPLVLRPPTPADVDAITEACQDPEIARWTRVPSPYTRADAERFVAGELSAAAGRSIQFVMAPAAAGEIYGAIGLQSIDWPARTAEIGYWLAPGARGRGHGARAVEALAAAALDAGFERLVAHVADGNLRSCRVLERAGFVHEGRLRSVSADGCGTGCERIDVDLYSRIVSDGSPGAGS